MLSKRNQAEIYPSARFVPENTGTQSPGYAHRFAAHSQGPAEVSP